MSELQTAFESAVAQAKQLPEKPDNPTLLKIYGLYKQATCGDNTERKPSFTDYVARAKWDAWNGQKGKDQTQAQSDYIDLITALR
jgi:diazepam-binding inhibitor (GABA receptor modulating acyl-CoA-binding protein)